MNELEKQRGTGHRLVNKATMDQPQEEFVADQGIPSHSDPASDREHGDEVEHAQRAHAEYAQAHRQFYAASGLAAPTLRAE